MSITGAKTRWSECEVAGHSVCSQEEVPDAEVLAYPVSLIFSLTHTGKILLSTTLTICLYLLFPLDYNP